MSGPLEVTGTVTATVPNPLPVSGAVVVTGVSTAVNQIAEVTIIGPVTEVAPATDTASSGLNGRLQRIAQNITSLISSALTVVGNVAAGVADTGNPVKAGGKYNLTLPTYADGQRGDLQLGIKGALRVSLFADTGTNTATFIAATDAFANTYVGLTTIGLNQVYNGSAWDRLRTPTVFKAFSGALITAETAIWTPTAGKKFRLMGFVVTQGVLTGDITVRDGTGLATILVIPATVIGQPLSFSMGNGILSGAINRVLTFQGAATETVSGFVYGTEE